MSFRIQKLRFFFLSLCDLFQQTSHNVAFHNLNWIFIKPFLCFFFSPFWEMHSKSALLFTCFNFYYLNIVFVSFIFNVFNKFSCWIDCSLFLKFIWLVSYPNIDCLICIKQHNIIIHHIILWKIEDFLHKEISWWIWTMEKTWFKS